MAFRRRKGARRNFRRRRRPFRRTRRLARRSRRMPMLRRMRPEVKNWDTAPIVHSNFTAGVTDKTDYLIEPASGGGIVEGTGPNEFIGRRFRIIRVNLFIDWGWNALTDSATVNPLPSLDSAFCQVAIVRLKNFTPGLSVLPTWNSVFQAITPTSWARRLDNVNLYQVIKTFNFRPTVGNMTGLQYFTKTLPIRNMDMLVESGNFKNPLVVISHLGPIDQGGITNFTAFTWAARVRFIDS